MVIRSDLSDELECGVSDLEHVTVGERIRFLRFQSLDAIDDGTVGAAKIFDKELIATRDNPRVTARDAYSRIKLCEVDCRSSPAVRIDSSDDRFAVRRQRKLGLDFEIEDH